LKELKRKQKDDKAAQKQELKNLKKELERLQKLKRPDATPPMAQEQRLDSIVHY
jgi:hypothetical protein